MEIGLHVPQVGPPATRENATAFAKAADDAGFDGLWVFDHVVLQKEQQSNYPYSADGRLGFPPTLDFLEPLTQLAYLAAITKRARLGTSVLVLPMRQPVLHAKIMATIDHLSGGRFVLGAGVGWWKQEFEVLSVPFERRGKRMDECLRLVRALWTEEFVNFRGEFYQAVDWTCNPKPVRPGGIPIWLGGESRNQLERVGKYADGWHATAKPLPTLRDDFEVAREAATRAGRDPSKLTLSIEGAGTLAPESFDRVAERLGRLKELGVFHGSSASTRPTWATLHPSSKRLPRGTSMRSSRRRWQERRRVDRRPDPPPVRRVRRPCLRPDRRSGPPRTRYLEGIPPGPRESAPRPLVIPRFLPATRHRHPHTWPHASFAHRPLAGKCAHETGLERRHHHARAAG